jgi:hypothetical protein
MDKFKYIKKPKPKPIPARGSLDVDELYEDPLMSFSPQSHMGRATKGVELSDSQKEWKRLLREPQTSYMLESDIENATNMTKEEIKNYMEEKGFIPRSGYRLDDERVITDFSPPQGKDKEYLTEDRDEIFVGLNSKEQKFGKIMQLLEGKDLSQEDIDKLLSIWDSGKIGFEKAIDFASKKLNKVIIDLDERLKFTSTNFETNFNLIYTYVEKLINERISQIKNISYALETALSNNADIAEAQIEEFNRIKDLVNNEVFQQNRREWLSYLSLLYGGSIKEIAINELDIKYPSDFQQLINIYKEFVGLDKEVIEKVVEKENPYTKFMNFIEREIPSATVSPGETANKRKILENIPTYKGLATIPNKTPFVAVKKKIADKEYERELYSLNQIKRSLNIIKQSLETVIDKDLIGKHIYVIGEIIQTHYKNTPVITKEGKIDARYSVGDESRFAIYLSLLSLAKAYYAWHGKITDIPTESLDKIDQDILIKTPISSIIKRLIKTSERYDNNKEFIISDKILNIINFLIK